MDREVFSQDAPVSWKELLAETARLLKGDNSELEAKWMIEEVSGLEYAEDYQEQAKPSEQYIQEGHAQMLTQTAKK